MKMAEGSPNGLKTLWEKEKLLVTSNFSLFHSVFDRHVLQTRKNQGLFGKELIDKGLGTIQAITASLDEYGELDCKSFI